MAKKYQVTLDVTVEVEGESAKKEVVADFTAKAERLMTGRKVTGYSVREQLLSSWENENN